MRRSAHSAFYRHSTRPCIPFKSHVILRGATSQFCKYSSCPGQSERILPIPAPQLIDTSLPPDHRTIAPTQQLLITSPYSPGSPLFLPHGAHVYNKLVEFLRTQYSRYGFKEVLTPNIYKRSLWETSGHWENYKEDMFEVIGRGSGGVKDTDLPDGIKEEYGLKPMNCPGHCLMFKATSGGRSLRDLPVRYADFSPLHRNENSGSLSGLTRVRRFHQDDGHIFCRPVQIKQEISSTLEFIETVYKVFYLPKPKLVLSTRPQNYIGDLEEWNRAEAVLREVLDSSRQPWTLNEGDGAFYGPKIDVILEDSNGKRHQTATVQLDFQLPRRFKLEYLAPAPALEQRGIIPENPTELAESGFVMPVIIHRAVLGSLERFMALLIEHYNGKWPFWLSPRQAIVIPVAMTDKIIKYARDVQRVISGVTTGKDINAGRPLPLSRRTFAVDIDESTNSLRKKVRAAKTNGYNNIIVIGERNVDADTVSIDARSPSNDLSAALQGTPRKAQSVDMKPAEVYEYFLNLENEYA